MNQEKYKNISKNLSMSEIAYRILKNSGNPMHYKRDLTQIMLKEIGYCSHGKTPWATLNAEIGRDNRFLKCRGIVSLKEWKNQTNNSPKTLEQSSYHDFGNETSKNFSNIPKSKNLRVVSKMEEDVGRGILNEDVQCDYFETYTEPLDRTK